MNTSHRFFVTALTFAALGLVATLPSACSDGGEGGTTGKRITLDVKVTSPETKAGFTNAMGWSITLDKAFVATGALYFYDGATIFSMAPSPRTAPASPLRELFTIKSAHAHPGHYVPGNARGEYLSGSSADLHAESAIGTGSGVSGITRSATFAFQSPAVGPFAGELGSHVAVFEGKATKGAEVRPFRAELDLADVVNTKNAPAIEGCPFEEVDMVADGVVTIELKPSRWFDQADFTAVAASTDGKPVLLTSADQPRRALARGMKAGLGYVFRYGAK